MRSRILALFLVLGVVVWAESSSGQVQPQPGPGTGVVYVRGTVAIDPASVVGVVQRGDFRVGLTSTPDVRVVNLPAVAMAPHGFIRTGGRYEVLWPTGERDIITVAQLGGAGWVRSDTGERRRWLNLDTARSLAEVQ